MEEKVKIIICPCTRQKLRDSGIHFEEKRTFHCKCVNNHHKSYFVLRCEERNMFGLLFSGEKFVFNCSRKNLSGSEICQNYVDIRYIFNYVTAKIYVRENLPKEIGEKWVNIEKYLSDIKNESFCYFCKRKNVIHVSLDNPDDFDILKNVKVLGEA